jgi:hypothetical protein
MIVKADRTGSIVKVVTKRPVPRRALGGDCPRRFGGGGLWVGRMIVRTDRTGSIVKVVTKRPGSPARPQRGLSPPLWRRQFGGRLNDCQSRQNRKDCENRYKSPGSPATPRRGLSPAVWRWRFVGRLNDCQKRHSRKYCENHYKACGSSATRQRGLSPPLWGRQFGWVG